MTTSNYSYSHEQRMSPERAALLARAHTVETATRYLNEVAVYTDPGLWPQAATEAAGGANLTTSDHSPRSQATFTAESAGTMMVHTAEQTQLLADARRRAAEEAV